MTGLGFGGKSSVACGEGAEEHSWVAGGITVKKLAILFALTACVALVGCNQLSTPQGDMSSNEPVNVTPVEESAELTSTTDQATDSTPVTDPSADLASTTGQSTDPAPATNQSVDPAPAEAEQTATLDIGTKASGFAEYPLTYEGELTPEALIQGIADLTGWNLTLAEPVVFGKGGMSVCLSNESSLFTGPPNPQNEEFHMFSAEQIAETILDSIQKTLQNAFVLEPGDPDTLDIWYYMEGQQPLELPNIGLSLPIDQPYQWAEVEVTQQ